MKDNKGTPTRESRPSERGTPHQGRSTSLERRKVPPENLDVGPKELNLQVSVRPQGSTRHQQKPKTHDQPKAHLTNPKVEPKDSHHKSPQGSTHHQSSHVSIHHQQKPKTLGVSKVHPTTSQGGPKDSHHHGAHGSTHHQQNPEIHIWVEIEAPLDSEKQAKVVVDKLKNCRGELQLDFLFCFIDLKPC